MRLNTPQCSNGVPQTVLQLNGIILEVFIAEAEQGKLHYKQALPDNSQ